jgi:hypothetical protein
MFPLNLLFLDDLTLAMLMRSMQLPILREAVSRLRITVSPALTSDCSVRLRRWIAALDCRVVVIWVVVAWVIVASSKHCRDQLQGGSVIVRNRA